ncbi:MULTISPECIES: hypothetical protein [Halorussus]|uniref:hypothetical protein n=1 Tax=Halorussus TaxID=1070314 RepID=UPI000E2182D1|nr:MULTISPECIES: hypothetical protein [Halorussus]NHN61313.1 hypothetical protein [Halorussus sp. JP-T4]
MSESHRAVGRSPTIRKSRRLSARGDLAADDEVVAVLTGTGLRELDAGSQRPETVALDDLPDRLRSLAG